MFPESYIGKSINPLRMQTSFVFWNLCFVHRYDGDDV